MWFVVLTQALLAFAVAYFVVRKGRRGAESDARYVSCHHGVGNYMFMPMAFTLPALWTVAIFVTCVGLGAIAGACNK